MIDLITFRHLLVLWRDTGHTRDELVPLGLLSDTHLHLKELLVLYLLLTKEVAIRLETAYQAVMLSLNRGASIATLRFHGACV